MKSRTTTKAVFTATAAASAFLMASPLLAGHTNEILFTELSGREEVANQPVKRAIVGDPNGRGEAYVFGIDDDEFTLCYVLQVERIELVPVGPVGVGMAAHIHEGVRGTNGPIVAMLAGPEDGNAADCISEGETGKFPTGEPGIVQRILESPENFYINVHNTEFPPGAVRGQLEPIEVDLREAVRKP